MTMDRRLLLGALVGFIGCGLALAIDARAMLASYLVAWIAISAVPIGAVAVLLTSYLVRAGWTQDMHEPLTAAALTIPAVAILFIPVLICMGAIYPWGADPSGLPAFKAAYLAPWWFGVRTLAYFAILTVLAVWAARAYGDDAAMTRAASAGLIAWSLVASFAGIDWMESVEPDFHSSIYGLLAISFALLASLAFAIVAVLLAGRRPRMGNASYSAVLLSVLLLWAYLHAMQYIIIWSGNLPDEVVWYLRRLEHGWSVPLCGLFLAQFIVPFFLLLSAQVRASTMALVSLAVATLALRVLEAAVLILPPLRVTNWVMLLALPAAALAVGASLVMAWRTAGQYRRGRSHRAAAAH
jgi:hypothetical protein